MNPEGLAHFMFPRLRDAKELFEFGDMLPVEMREPFYKEMVRIDGQKLKKEVEDIKTWLRHGI